MGTVDTTACVDFSKGVSKNKEEKDESEERTTDCFIIVLGNQNTKDKTVEKQGAPWLACITRDMN